MNKIIEFFKSRIRFNKFNFYIFLELLVISAIALGSSYFFEKKLFLFNKDFNYYYVIVMIIGLYYGLGSGFILVSLFSLAGYLFYSAFPYYFFIHAVLVALIAGEFNFYFKIHLAELDAEVDFLKDKLRQIGKTALFTKLSHDNLEKSYFTKPYTLRSIVLDLANKNSYEDFIRFLANQFHITSFALIEGDKIFKHNITKVNLEDELIENMYEKKTMLYVKEKVDYLAAIPIMVSDNIDAFILIEDMPFIHYNIENLVAIQFTAEFFYLNKRDDIVIKEIKDDKLCKYISCKRVIELYDLIKLHQIVHSHSSIVFFDLDKLHSETFENFLTRSLRSLDFFEKIPFINQDLFIVVLPFTSKEGGMFFVERVLEMVKYLSFHNNYQVYEIDSLEKIRLLIEARNAN